MRLLLLDYDPVYGDASDSGTTRGSFSGDLTAFDYDLVIWDPAASFRAYAAYSSEYQGLRSLSESQSVRIQADVKRRRQEFLEFINMGRTLVITVRPPQACYVDTGQKSYSGTGRSRVTTRHVDMFDIWRAMPIDDLKLTLASGNRVEFQGDGPITRLLRKYKKFLRYDAYMDAPPGAVAAKVNGTNRSVGSILRSKSGGHLLMMPAMRFDIDYNADEDYEPEGSEEGWVPEASEFQADLIAALEQLGGVSVATRPAWADGYMTKDQRKLREDIAKQQKRVESARDKLSLLQQNREEDESKQQLFLGTGRALELEVKKVLELLGGTVTEPEPGRDDWRVSFPEGDAVVEVKGLTKSAAEKNAAQLEKWVAGALEETEQKHKGLLVVNTWREKPLSERTGDDFPSQMIPYCIGREHCLVTGLQMFVIRTEIEAQPARAAHWRTALLETVGRITGCDDWQSFLEETESAES